MVAAAVSTWLFATSTTDRNTSSAANHTSTLRRNDAFKRAGVRLDPADTVRLRPFHEAVISCRFIREEPSGTSAKFSCALEDGQIIKVKYGRNPEIQAEVAGTQLLHTLGFAADDVTIVSKVRCYGCPRFPFLTMQLMSLTRTMNLIGPHGYENGYSDFEWAGVERKFAATAIETDTQEGWAWFALKASQAPRADVDAFRLLAVFLAHWDNKASNQRLVCLDRGRGVQEHAADEAAQQPCARPLLMIQDLGATFGPTKVNLARWRDLPVWADRQTCKVSMHALPYRGATFPDVEISEAGRLQLARQLSAIDESAVRAMFANARFPEFYSGTDDTRDLDRWTAAFRSRVDQIVTRGPCPAVTATS